MEPWRPVDACHEGMEDQTGVSRPVVADSHHIDDQVKGEIRTRNTAFYVTKYVFSALIFGCLNIVLIDKFNIVLLD